jgi:hypothetical protein
VTNLLSFFISTDKSYNNSILVLEYNFHYWFLYSKNIKGSIFSLNIPTNGTIALMMGGTEHYDTAADGCIYLKEVVGSLF